jgi:hypothetical protein
MLPKAIRIFIGFLMLLHFVGASQYVCALVKDKSSFVNMAGINEEESKKEKDTKEELNDAIDTHIAAIHTFSDILAPVTSIIATLANDEIKHQYIAEQLAPPPDVRA